MAEEVVYTVAYEVTGYMNDNLLMVKFTMGTVSENLTFSYDGSKPIEEFLGEQATFAAPGLAQKAAAKEAGVSLSQYVGTKGSVLVPEQSDPPMPMGTTRPFFRHNPH